MKESERKKKKKPHGKAKKEIPGKFVSLAGSMHRTYREAESSLREGLAVSTLRGLPISAHRASGLRTRILRTYLFWQALLRDPILPLA